MRAAEAFDPTQAEQIKRPAWVAWKPRLDGAKGQLLRCEMEGCKGYREVWRW